MTWGMGYERHIPVMVEETMRLLLTRGDGFYIDATLGTGGHAWHILERGGKQLRLVGLDRDGMALAEAKSFLAPFSERVTFTLGNFRHIKNLVGTAACDGVLADLGLSTLQLSDPGRGFSYQTDGPLVMSMGEGGRSVEELLAAGSERQLGTIIRTYGEERRYRSIAREIVKARREGPIERTGQLRDIIERAIPERGKMSSLSRVFQSFRIWSNEELESLEEFLPQAVELLRPGGRLVVISYHSLEDRIVKQFFKKEEAGCICPPEFPECRCQETKRMRTITRRPIRSASSEVEANPKARSARLRAAERI
jgi:16S rRNA (cytosine1402-N4)-methyltransferase